MTKQSPFHAVSSESEQDHPFAQMNDHSVTESLLLVRNAAIILGLPTSAVFKLIIDQSLPALKIDDLWWIQPISVRAFLDLQMEVTDGGSI
jgi:hypothetical protein